MSGDLLVFTSGRQIGRSSHQRGYIVDFSVVALAFLLLFLLVACWFGLHYLGNPPLENPDGIARVTGNCGDTMELALCFADAAVARTRHWTDGCSVSNRCIEAAAMLASGKSVSEIKRINMMAIMEITGQLPDTHLHCAQLAETTLQHAVVDYLQKRSPESCHDHNSC